MFCSVSVIRKKIFGIRQIYYMSANKRKRKLSFNFDEDRHYEDDYSSHITIIIIIIIIIMDKNKKIRIPYKTTFPCAFYFILFNFMSTRSSSDFEMLILWTEMKPKMRNKVLLLDWNHLNTNFAKPKVKKNLHIKINCNLFSTERCRLWFE